MAEVDLVSVVLVSGPPVVCRADLPSACHLPPQQACGRHARLDSRYEPLQNRPTWHTVGHRMAFGVSVVFDAHGTAILVLGPLFHPALKVLSDAGFGVISLPSYFL